MQIFLTAVVSVFVYGIRFCVRSSMCESTRKDIHCLDSCWYDATFAYRSRFRFLLTAFVSAFGPACAYRPEWILIALTRVGTMKALLSALVSVLVYGIRFRILSSMCESTRMGTHYFDSCACDANLSYRSRFRCLRHSFLHSVQHVRIDQNGFS